MNFVQNLNYTKIQCLLNKLTEARQMSDSVGLEDVNALCNQFSEIFNESADSCCNKANVREKNNRQPWFGHQCESSRKRYHRTKKMHAKYPSTASKASLVTASKLYKKKLNFFIWKHKKETPK